jgi:CheY-like chemotaxis protein
LLAFSRRQPFNPQIIVLGERVDEFRSMLASSIGGAVTLTTAIEPDAWAVRVDINELELALINIVLNSRDAMPNGGLISITTENVTLSPKDTDAGIEGDFVALRVTDTGSGIAPDILSKIFDPFFTTKEAGKGSGLGLSQVHGFAHQSGGTVEVKTELGRGTTVVLYLPRAEADSPDRQVENCIDTADGGAVLVVEDNPEVAEVTISMLQQLGYSVSSATNAASALAMFENKRFDLVVSDIVMAGDMDGVGLARAIRDRAPEVAVLLVTGYSQAAQDALSEFPLLRKPFQIEELSRTSARLIAEARQPASSNIVRLKKPSPAAKSS